MSTTPTEQEKSASPLLNQPPELRALIIEFVLEHEQHGCGEGDDGSVPWKKIELPAPSESGGKVDAYVQPLHWPYQGLIHCSRQLCRDVNAVVDHLHAKTPRSAHRILNACYTNNPARSYFTWKGPSWMPVDYWSLRARWLPHHPDNYSFLEVHLGGSCPLERAGLTDKTTRASVALRDVGRYLRYRLPDQIRSPRRCFYVNKLVVILDDKASTPWIEGAPPAEACARPKSSEDFEVATRPVLRRFLDKIDKKMVFAPSVRVGLQSISIACGEYSLESS